MDLAGSAADTRATSSGGGGMALCRDDLWFFAAMVTAGAAMTCVYVLLHG